MSESSIVDKIQALKMAKNMGCSGAHKDKNGNWMPCSSHDEMQKISNIAEGDKWRSAVPGYKGEDGRVRGRKRRRRNDSWEKLNERPISSIQTLPGGGLVSGPASGGITASGPISLSSADNGMETKVQPGPEYVRDNDPDVFQDIESARFRSRQLGCIGVSRRVSKTGRMVWMPCSNNSDYSRLAGATALGRRGQQRDFERAVRTVLMSELNRPKRKVSVYQEIYNSQ